MVVNYCQQAPPSLTFVSPLAKLNLEKIGSGVLKISKQLLKSTRALKQEFSSGLEWTDLTFKLTHISFNYGAP